MMSYIISFVFITCSLHRNDYKLVILSQMERNDPPCKECQPTRKASRRRVFPQTTAQSRSTQHPSETSQRDGDLYSQQRRPATSPRPGVSERPAVPQVSKTVSVHVQGRHSFTKPPSSRQSQVSEQTAIKSRMLEDSRPTAPTCSKCPPSKATQIADQNLTRSPSLRESQITTQTYTNIPSVRVSQITRQSLSISSSKERQNIDLTQRKFSGTPPPVNEIYRRDSTPRSFLSEERTTSGPRPPCLQRELSTIEEHKEQCRKRSSSAQTEDHSTPPKRKKGNGGICGCCPRKSKKKKMDNKETQTSWTVVVVPPPPCCPFKKESVPIDDVSEAPLSCRNYDVLDKSTSFVFDDNVPVVEPTGKVSKSTSMPRFDKATSISDLAPGSCKRRRMSSGDVKPSNSGDFQMQVEHRLSVQSRRSEISQKIRFSETILLPEPGRSVCPHMDGRPPCPALSAQQTDKTQEYTPKRRTKTPVKTIKPKSKTGQKASKQTQTIKVKGPKKKKGTEDKVTQTSWTIIVLPPKDETCPCSADNKGDLPPRDEWPSYLPCASVPPQPSPRPPPPPPPQTCQCASELTKNASVQVEPTEANKKDKKSKKAKEPKKSKKKGKYEDKESQTSWTVIVIPKEPICSCSKVDKDGFPPDEGRQSISTPGRSDLSQERKCPACSMPPEVTRTVSVQMDSISLLSPVSLGDKEITPKYKSKKKQKKPKKGQKENKRTQTSWTVIVVPPRNECCPTDRIPEVPLPTRSSVCGRGDLPPREEQLPQPPETCVVCSKPTLRPESPIVPDPRRDVGIQVDGESEITKELLSPCSSTIRPRAEPSTQSMKSKCSMCSHPISRRGPPGPPDRSKFIEQGTQTSWEIIMMPKKGEAFDTDEVPEVPLSTRSSMFDKGERPPPDERPPSISSRPSAVLCVCKAPESPTIPQPSRSVSVQMDGRPSSAKPPPSRESKTIAQPQGTTPPKTPQTRKTPPVSQRKKSTKRSVCCRDKPKKESTKPDDKPTVEVTEKPSRTINVLPIEKETIPTDEVPLSTRRSVVDKGTSRLLEGRKTPVTGESAKVSTGTSMSRCDRTTSTTAIIKAPPAKKTGAAKSSSSDSSRTCECPSKKGN